MIAPKLAKSNRPWKPALAQQPLEPGRAFPLAKDTLLGQFLRSNGRPKTPVGASSSPDAGDPDKARENIMLTRRGFAGFASCAICAVTGFVATDASAETAPPAAATPGVTRKILSQTDGPVPGYVTLIVEVEIEPGVMIARHTHPGIESAYVIEGGLDLPVEGQPIRSLKPGDGFVVPAQTPHAGGKNGDKKTKIASTYVVEKGKPLASPA
jgi:quercetin dioxygenase-like cupin family protein